MLEILKKKKKKKKLTLIFQYFGSVRKGQTNIFFFLRPKHHGQVQVQSPFSLIGHLRPPPIRPDTRLNTACRPKGQSKTFSFLF